MKGYDFNGVVDTGNFMLTVQDVIITGNTKVMAESVLSWLYERGIFCPVYFMPYPGWANNNVGAGMWKAEMVKRLGVDTFFEDNPQQHEIIQQLNPGCEVVKV